MNEKEIITTLKNGNVPYENVLSFCTGREEEIETFKELLNDVESGSSQTKFIKGEYGAGKSFFLKVIEEIAFKEDFVVSWVTLSNDVRMNKIDVIYNEIAHNLKCKTGTSIKWLIDRWIDRLNHRIPEEIKGNEKEEELFIMENINNDLERVYQHSSRFPKAIEYYVKTRKSKLRADKAADAIGWLTGEKKIPAKNKKEFNVKGDINKDDAYSFLKALSEFITAAGYSGLVILIDEAESIQNINRRQWRDDAYDYIRKIFDDCAYKNFESTLFLFAGTPPFFNNRTDGIASYKALDDRIKSSLNDETKDNRRTIISLQGFNKEDLLNLSNNLIKIHEKAYNWDSEGKIDINYMVDKEMESASLNNNRLIPRKFIKNLIDLLEAIQQNPENSTMIINKHYSNLNMEDNEDDW
jgi:hypothetical protein